jgi:cholesterol oxidase
VRHLKPKQPSEQQKPKQTQTATPPGRHTGRAPGEYAAAGHTARGRVPLPASASARIPVPAVAGTVPDPTGHPAATPPGTHPVGTPAVPAAARAGAAHGRPRTGARRHRGAGRVRGHHHAIVVGSGFGGAVAALRLGRAGVDTLVLERGRHWPVAPAVPIFGTVSRPTNTMFWFRDTLRHPLLPPLPVRPGPGLLEVAEEDGLDIYCAAAVGGGSVAYTGVTVAPPRRWFESLYPAGLAYREFESRWFPLARTMLGASPLPGDLYEAKPFTHARRWDRQMARAGFPTVPLDSVFDWDVIRAELAGRAPADATLGNSDFGCGNGAKKDLTRTYLPAALATGHVRIAALHEVRSVARRADGRFALEVRRLGPDGSVRDTTEHTCRLLFVAAGTLNTNRLLVAARDRDTLPGLPDTLGTGFGDNGDRFPMRTAPLDLHGIAQAAPSASGRLIAGRFELPLVAESWAVPGENGSPFQLTFTMTVDHDQRGTFRHDPATGRVRLTGWAGQSDAAARCARAYNRLLAEAEPGTEALPLPDHPAAGHPVGGCVIGRSTDLEGRVTGVPGLYVLDGSLLPGSVGGANPSLTITALAERAMSRIVAAGA